MSSIRYIPLFLLGAILSYVLASPAPVSAQVYISASATPSSGYVSRSGIILTNASQYGYHSDGGIVYQYQQPTVPQTCYVCQTYGTYSYSQYSPQSSYTTYPSYGYTPTYYQPSYGYYSPYASRTYSGYSSWGYQGY